MVQWVPHIATDFRVWKEIFVCTEGKHASDRIAFSLYNYPPSDVNAYCLPNP